MSGYALGQSYGYGLSEQTTLSGVNPAAGSAFALKLGSTDAPGGYKWRLVGATWKLTTDANAANRYVTVEYLGGDGVSVLGDAAAKVVVANVTAQRYCGSVNRGVGEVATGTDILLPLSGLWLEAGATVQIAVANIQVGDTLTVIRLTFDRVPTDPDYKPYMTDESG